jgi:1-acyl-sn-glycerol-3-phosphate acyltransferase
MRFHRWAARAILGIRSRIDGVPPAGSVLVAVKHQSMFETLEIMLMLDQPAMVLKRELADIPLWGWVVRRYGAIPIVRSGGAAALRRMMRAAEAAIAEGRPIVIFPEGTRVAPGERPPLKSGFAGLYRALKLPVVPVAVDSGRLWPRHRWIKRPGIVTMRFGEPIPPGLPRAEAEAAVHRAINALEEAG